MKLTTSLFAHLGSAILRAMPEFSDQEVTIPSVILLTTEPRFFTGLLAAGTSPPGDQSVAAFGEFFRVFGDAALPLTTVVSLQPGLWRLSGHALYQSNYSDLGVAGVGAGRVVMLEAGNVQTPDIARFSAAIDQSIVVPIEQLLLLRNITNIQISLGATNLAGQAHHLVLCLHCARLS